MALVPLMLIAGLVAGCGDDDSSSDSSSGDYCDIARNIKDDVDSIDFENLDEAAFDQLQDNLDQLESAAPSDVKDSWALLADKFRELDTILSDAGISLDDLTDIQAGQMPEGLDMAQLQELSTKLTEFSDTSELDPALEEIQKNLKDECGIETEDDGS
jgi:hypothetical protein